MLNMVSATAPEMMEYFQPKLTENTRKPNMPTTIDGREGERLDGRAGDGA